MRFVSTIEIHEIYENVNILEKDKDYKCLNCEKSIQNYFTCMENNVDGFIKRFSKNANIEKYN